MKYSETLLKLLKKDFDGKLSDPEKEQLFFLSREEGADDHIISELYTSWKAQLPVSSEKRLSDSFQSLREKLGITDEKLRQDKLVLEGMGYKRSRDRSFKALTFIKYAAAVVLLVCAGWILGLLSNDTIATPDIGFNEITVPNGSKIRVNLPDSTSVWLNSGSTLRYSSIFNNETREVYLEGEAFFDVTENPSRPFFVRTSEIDIKVLGTRFNLKAYPDEDLIETTLVSGKIEILKPESSKNAKILELEPDQKACYSKKENVIRLEDKAKAVRKQQSTIRAATVLKSNTLTEYEENHIEIKWKDNKLIFRNEALETLSRKLERWYGVDIMLEDKVVEQVSFTGTIANETIEQTMDAFALASSIEYKINKNKITIWQSRK